MCVTDNLFSMEGKASFWSIISDTCPLDFFRVMLTQIKAPSIVVGKPREKQKSPLRQTSQVKAGPQGAYVGILKGQKFLLKNSISYM